jgi:hypothetical protein
MEAGDLVAAGPERLFLCGTDGSQRQCDQAIPITRRAPGKLK